MQPEAEASLDEKEHRCPEPKTKTRRYQRSEMAYYSKEEREAKARRPQKSETACCLAEEQ
jgi:hypothetical protein